MAHLTELNKISIVEIAVYVPFLIIASLLCWRHGFGRSSGWLYLIIFSLMRILGGGFQLGTINSPTNYNLIIGAQVLLGVGLSPLLLVGLGLTSHIHSSIPENARPSIPNARTIRLVQLIVFVGMILGIVGGSSTGNQIGSDIANNRPLVYKISPISEAGAGCMIAGYALLAISVVLLATHKSDIPQGETRLLVAIFLALPFILVRVIFSSMSIFDSTNTNYRMYSSGSGYYNHLLGMCTIPEIICVLIFEAVGFSLPYVPQGDRPHVVSRGSNTVPLTEYPDTPYQGNQGQGAPKPFESA